MALRFNRRRVGDTLLLLSALLALATLFASLARLWWAFDLFSHFRVQYAVAALLLALPLLFLRRWAAAVFALAVLAANLWLVIPAVVAPTPAVSPASDPVRVLAMNVFGFNTEYELALAHVRRERPDVLIVLEVTPDWAEALRGLSQDYPYQWLHPGDLRSGIAVFSKRMPLRTQQLDLAGTGDPSQLITIPTANGALSILGVHLYWPMGSRVSAVRNEQLRTLARISREHDVPLVIAGDFNTSPFSPHFARLLQDGRLRDCAWGRGLNTTWPARVPFFAIRIDHCVATAGVRVHDFRIGGYIGSDHYPILMEISAAKP